MILKSLTEASTSLVAVICASAALAACTSDVEPGSGAQVAVSSASAALATPPTVQLDSPGDYQRQNHHLQFGNNNDAYWMEDNTWGAGSATEGTASNQFEQNVGVYPPVGPNGEVAFRMKWRWPEGLPGEVKGFPAVLSGRKPGYYSSGTWVNGQPIRLLDGTFSEIAPSGYTPGTFMPLQLPIPALTAKFARSNATPPTGQGQLTFDFWLQSHPGQDAGWVNASITHEIMIILDNWGGYGTYPYNRNPQWYDHDAVINGRLYHVYCTKGQDGVLRYNFGWLNGRYGRYGWKMIAFLPDVTPVPPGEIDVAAFINYLKTRTDSAGTPWAQGNEYLVSAELGVEPVVGSGDIVIYDYKLSPTSVPRTTRIQAENGTLSGSGVSVKTDSPGYEGSGFVGTFTNNGDRATVSFTNVAAGMYDIRIRYASGILQLNDVVINGTTWSTTFPATTSWGIRTIPAVALTAGTNTISIIKDYGWINVDYIEIAPASDPSGGSTARKKQLESGSLTGAGARIETNFSGYEGSGAVGPFNIAGDRATVSFTNVAAGTYNIRLRYRLGTSHEQWNSVILNGVSRSEHFAVTGSNWQIKTISGVALNAGTNTVAVSKEWGYFWVDYIEIVPASP